jgi:hypothetical protein
MPRLTFPFLPDGLCVPALVGPSTATTQLQVAPRHVRGLIDSGTTITAVAPWLLAALNVTPGPATQTRTIAGSVTVRFFQISFTIYDPTGPGPDLFRPDWLVTNMLEDPDDVDVLFGLDLLREIVLTVDGPALFFTIDF